jgi:curved DNA-binding protein CbpA
VTDPYAELGVPATAEDAAIRAHYLQLVQRYTPERHPAEFAKYREAYEKIKDADARIKHHIFAAFEPPNLDRALELAATASAPPARPTLQQLLAALPKSK